MPHTDATRLMNQNPTLALFAPKVQHALVTGSEFRSFGPGESLFALGDKALGAYFLVDGEVSLTSPDFGHKSAVAADLLEPYALLIPREHSFSARATRETGALIIGAKLFAHLRSHHTELNARMAGKLRDEVQIHLGTLARGLDGLKRAVG